MPVWWEWLLIFKLICTLIKSTKLAHFEIFFQSVAVLIFRFNCLLQVFSLPIQQLTRNKWNHGMEKREWSLSMLTNFFTSFSLLIVILALNLWLLSIFTDCVHFLSIFFIFNNNLLLSWIKTCKQLTSTGQWC